MNRVYGNKTLTGWNVSSFSEIFRDTKVKNYLSPKFINIQIIHIMKQILLFVLILFFAGNMLAQRGIEIGAQLQPQSVWIMNSDEADLGPELDYEATWGSAFGLQGGINFNDNFGLMAGLLFSSQGQKYIGTGGMGWTTAQKKLSYTKIPIYIKLNSNPFVGTSFLFQLGPQFSFLNNARYFEDDKEITQLNVGTNHYENYKVGYKSMDLGGMIAFGVRFNFTENLFLSVLMRFDGTFNTIEDMEQVNFPIFFNPANHNDSASRRNAARLTDGRRDTRNLTGGLNIAVGYVLN